MVALNLLGLALFFILPAALAITLSIAVHARMRVRSLQRTALVLGFLAAVVPAILIASGSEIGGIHFGLLQRAALFAFVALVLTGLPCWPLSYFTLKRLVQRDRPDPTVFD